MIKVFNNSNEFLKQYKDYLSHDEVQYTLILGISQRDNPTYQFIASIINDDFLLGVLAGKNLILASNTLNNQVYKDMIEYMDNIEYPGIIGTRSHCEKYNEIYKEKYNTSLMIRMNQRIYSCSKVNNYSENIGYIRLATSNDFLLLKEWVMDFVSRIEPETTELQVEDTVRNKILNQTLYVLVVDNEVVSMTGRARALINTETVSLVYTPEVYRKRGYASRIVEEVTRYIHNDGRLATLYTDLDNPISNSIYMKIGFVPHCDSVMMNKSM